MIPFISITQQIKMFVHSSRIDDRIKNKEAKKQKKNYYQLVNDIRIYLCIFYTII